MTAVAPGPAGMMTSEVLPARSAASQDWNDILKWGAIGAASIAFLALTGMLVVLDPRPVISGALSLGYVAMIWVPLVLGYTTTKQVVLEGMARNEQGAADVVRGALIGALTGAGMSILAVLVNAFDLRDPLVNWSPELLAKLGFDRGLGFGVIAWIVLGAVLGALGASLHLMPARIAKTLGIVVGTILFVSIFEAFLDDLLEGFGLTFLTDFLYASRGGLTIVSTIVLGIAAALFGMFGSGKSAGLTAKLDAMEAPQRKNANMLIWAAGLAALVLLPIFTGKITNELLANVGIFLLLALGLNIVVGLAGILDLGYVAFFAVGGYTVAILTSPNSPGFSPGLPWWVALIVTVFMAVLAGLLIGAPVIRMRGDYLAIVTLGFGEIIRLLALSDWLKGWFGGAQGITNIPPADFGLFEVKGTDPRSVYYLTLFFVLVAIYVSWRLEGSRLGRAWMAVREDESVAEAMGINTVNIKLAAFVVGAVLASFGGAILSAKVGSIFPTSFLILVSVIILVVVIVGGMGNIAGVIAGSVVLIGVLGGPKQPGLLQEFSTFKLLIYGALLVWMMLKRPEGLIPNARRTRELHQEEFLQDAWLKGEIDTDDDDVADAVDTVVDAVDGEASTGGAPA